MIECFFLSIVSGFLVGMPVGVAGAMVADCALQHIRRRTIATVIAAGMGDFVIAILAGYFASHLAKFIQEKQDVFSYCASGLLIIVGLVLFIKAWKHRAHHEFIEPEIKQHSAESYILKHTGPALAVFWLTVLHPANFLFVAGLAGSIQGRLDHDFNAVIFALGLGLGSIIVFSLAAFLFWKLGKKAGNFVYVLRFALAIMIMIIGVVFFFVPLNIDENMIQTNLEQKGKI